jgi:hypothetical protein
MTYPSEDYPAATCVLFWFREYLMVGFTGALGSWCPYLKISARWRSRFLGSTALEWSGTTGYAAPAPMND